MAFIEGMLDGHDMLEELPPLERVGMRQGEDGRWVDYQLGELSMSVLWMVSDNEWKAARAELPPPPLEPALVDFRTAWNSSDARAVAAFFPSGNQAQMEASLLESARGRGWTRYPAIRNTKVGATIEGETGVDFVLEEGTLGTRWSLRQQGRWGLSFLKLPKR